MPTLYMIFWSMMMILALSVWRLRHWRKTMVVTLFTALVLLMSNTLFVQLSLSAGLDPNIALSAPSEFIRAGLFGWLALLVMPCGWLGPVLGVHLVEWHSNLA